MSDSRSSGCLNAIEIGLLILVVVVLCIGARLAFCGPGLDDPCPDYGPQLRALWPAFLEGMKKSSEDKPVGFVDWFSKWFGGLIILGIIWVLLSGGGSYWDPITKSLISYGGPGGCSIIIIVILFVVFLLAFGSM